MKKRFFSLLCAGVLMSGSVCAQELTPDTIHALRYYNGSDNWFIGAQGGINYPGIEDVRFKTMGKYIGYSAQIHAGKFFNPTLGVRFTGGYDSYWGANSNLDNGNYHFNSLSTFVDGMLNFNSLFCKYKESTKVNVNGLLGIGYNYFWGYDNELDKQVYGNKNYPYRTTGHHFLAIRLGMQFAIKLSEAVDLNIEGTLSSTDDFSNAVYYQREYDYYARVLAGITYHFKDRYGDRRMKYDYYTDANKVAELNDEINRKRNELEEASKIIIKDENVYSNTVDDDIRINYLINDYKVDKTQASQVALIAEYLKEHPEAKANIVGYADVKTGVPVYNLYIAQRRADYVKKMLVKGYKIKEDRIITESKGDTVQPYENENDWNRVVFVTFE